MIYRLSHFCRTLTQTRIFSGVFPEPDKDPVIQIGNMVIRQGEAEPFVQTIFTLKQCAPIVGSKVKSYNVEKEMLDVSFHFLLLFLLLLLRTVLYHEVKRSFKKG